MSMHMDNAIGQNNESKRTHKRSNFTPDEDNRLRILVGQFGENSWRVISSYMPSRNVRQCRERWIKYLNPNVCTSKWTREEDMLLIQKRQELGPKWKDIASFFHGRTDINIKSRFNVLKRRAMRINSLLKYQNSFKSSTMNNFCDTKEKTNNNNDQENPFDQYDNDDSNEDPFEYESSSII